MTGLDADSVMISAARRRTEIEGTHCILFEGQAETLPFDGAAFDLVVAVTVLCFVRDADERFWKWPAYSSLAGGLLLANSDGGASGPHSRIRGRFGDPTWRAAMFRYGNGTSQAS